MKIIYFFFSIFSFTFLSLSFYSHHAFAQESNVSIPNITPYWIKRQEYNTSSTLIFGKGNKNSTVPQDQSLFSAKNLFTVIPGVAGGLSIILGSIITGLTFGKKKKRFKQYMQQVLAADKIYLDTRGKDGQSQKKAAKIFHDSCIKLLEELDLAAAENKIADEQRRTIVHTIERKLSEYNVPLSA